jgi:mannosyltransferase
MFKKIFQSKLFPHFFLVFLIGLATLISVRFWLPESLRLDESQSIWQSNRSYMDMLEVLARDVHMPLYGTLLHFWIETFGNNISTNRILSLAFYLASIYASYIVTLEFTRKQKIALYVAIMFTISPFLNWFGSELRMYSLFTFLTLCMHYLFYKIFYRNEASLYHWLAYFVCLILGVYTHYFFLVFIFCQVMFLLFNRHFLSGNKKWLLGSAVVVTVISFVPWAMYVKYINSASSQTPLLTKPSTVDLFNLYSNHLFGFQEDNLNTVILSIWPLAGLFVLFLLQKKNMAIQLKHYYLATMAFLPTFLLFVISILIRPIFLSRYLIMCLPPLYILIALLLFSQKNNLLKVLRPIFILAMIASLVVQIVNPKAPIKEDYRGVINYVISQVKSNDIVAATAPFTIYPFDYYYNGSAKLITVPDWDRKSGIPDFNEAKFIDQLDVLSKDNNKLYLVLSYDQGYEKKVVNIVNTKLDLESEKEFPQIRLMVFRFRK